MNMRSNRVSWMKTWPNDLCYSGVLTTRGGLVFVGRNDGRIQAYDDLSGKLLWQSPKLRAGANSAPITYTVNGKQYLVIWVGGNSVTAFATGAAPKFGADLYAFALPS